MRMQQKTLMAALVFACGLGPSAAADLPPISLAKQGVFFVGGRYSQTKAGTVMDSSTKRRRCARSRVATRGCPASS